jgi:triacylglycerol lipase
MRAGPVAPLMIATLAVACGGGGSAIDAAPASIDARAVVIDAPVLIDAPVVVDAAPLPDPVLFIHGINGSAADWDALKARLIAAGWPADRMMARTFPDPSWGCNLDNAALIKTWADELKASTGATRIDMVIHSMGALSSRYFMKNFGGAGEVGTYVSLGGMHHGLFPPCLSPLDVCVWKEICSTNPFVAGLDAAPAIPGPARWVSIYSTGDTTMPNASSQLDGAENIVVSGLTHTGLLDDGPVAAEVMRVLVYP